MKRLIIGVIVCFLSAGIAAAYQSSRLPDDFCEDRPEPYAGQDAAIADMRAMDAQFDLRWFDVSRSCRYALASFITPETGENRRLFVVWDLQTGERKIEHIRPHGRLEEPRWAWNTNETEIVIGGYWNSVYPYADFPHGVHHLFDLVNNRSVVLHCEPDESCIENVDRYFVWDDTRNWLWSAGDDGILAYDRVTGAAVFSFFSPPWGLLPHEWMPESRRFFFSADQSHVVVYYLANSGLHSGLTVWNIDQRTAQVINVEGYLARGNIALSPDNRYLAVGDNMIRVWDLHNLPEAYEDRLPLYRHDASEGRIDGLRFIDNTTLETRDFWRQTACWNVVSGEQVTCPPDAS